MGEKVLGCRQPFASAGPSYRWIARDLGISKNTVAAIVARSKEAEIDESAAAA